MTTDIFKLFKHSIEQVDVKNMPRGTYEPEAPTFNVSLDAIVKRRNAFAEEVAESEDKQSRTTIHFRATDAQYIAVGNYVKIDGDWHSIIEVRDGKDFDKGTSKFLYVIVGDDILQVDDEPVWGEVISA